MKAGEGVVFDKAYVDFKHLKTLSDRGVSWVIRSKDNMLYEVMGQQATVGGQDVAADGPVPSASPEPDAYADAAGKDVGQQMPVNASTSERSAVSYPMSTVWF